MKFYSNIVILILLFNYFGCSIGLFCDTFVCNDFNLCTTDICDTNLQYCVFTPITCNDGDQCTVDTCEPKTGCKNSIIPNCIECGNSSCVTMSLCNPKTCNGGECVDTPVSCNDNNVCTFDSCSPSSGECIYTPVVCNDSNGCTSDSCNPQLGCINIEIPNCFICDDGSACVTSDLCNPKECSKTQPSTCISNPIVCTNNDICFKNVCNSTDGQCYPTPDNVVCNDGNSCTIDSCQNVTGCINQQIPNCIECGNETSCITTDLCFPQRCNSSELPYVCVEIPISCSTPSVCQTGSCDQSSGTCIFTHINCNDNDDCTTDSCNPTTGCEFIPIPNCVDCNNGTSNCVTTDICNPQMCSSIEPDGCIDVPVICSNINACATVHCNSTTGFCDLETINCDDNNVCTIDTCDGITGCINEIIPGCIPCNGIPCVTTTKCNPKTCNDSVCTSNPVVCPDSGDLCSPYICLPDGNCILKFPVICIPSTNCTQSLCNKISGQCLESPLNCDDRNDCTADSCSLESGCINEPIPNCLQCGNGKQCISHDLCFPVTCTDEQEASQCIIVPVICENDNNSCTSQKCSSITGSCVTLPIKCSSDGDPCTEDFCDPIKGCVHIQNPSLCGCNETNCISNNLCSSAECVNNNCVITPKNCSSPDKCIQGSCNNTTGICQFIPITTGDCGIGDTPTPRITPTPISDPCSLIKCSKGKRCFNIDGVATCQKTDCLSCEDLNCPSQGLKCISTKYVPSKSNYCHDCCEYFVTCSN